MCLLRLTNLLENDIISCLEESALDEKGLTEDILHILEPAQVRKIYLVGFKKAITFGFFQICNAKQLTNWCLHHLCCNCKMLLEHHGKLFKTLSNANQEYINVHRWPPLW